MNQSKRVSIRNQLSRYLELFHQKLDIVLSQDSKRGLKYAISALTVKVLLFIILNN